MDIDLKLNQKMVITPQIEQSIKILQMGAQELTDYLEQLSVENPVIEVETNYAEADSQEKLKRKLEWLDSIDEENKVHYQAYQEEGRSEAFDFSRIETSDEESLQDYLQSQINELELCDREYEIAGYIISCLNENGYLEMEIEEVVKGFSIDKNEVEEVLKIVQSLEPSGVGARDLKECLIIQLRNREMETPILHDIICNHLEKLSRNQFNAVAKDLKVSVEKVKEAYSIIRTLNPRPGSLFNPGMKPRYITPDVVVVKFKDYYEVLLGEFLYPKITISSYYRNLMTAAPDEETKKYITKKVDQANWVLKCIDERNKTLLNVTKAIVDIQKNFFEKGPGYLCPMILRDVAERLMVHESTVSRAVRDKYLQSSWGVFELKYFFTHGLETKGGADATVENIKLMIKEIINGENPKKPYSDQKITDLLNEKGINISRRTVAKYREEMNIAAASGRKE